MALGMSREEIRAELSKRPMVEQTMRALAVAAQNGIGKVFTCTRAERPQDRSFDPSFLNREIISAQLTAALPKVPIWERHSNGVANDMTAWYESEAKACAASTRQAVLLIIEATTVMPDKNCTDIFVECMTAAMRTRRNGDLVRVGIADSQYAHSRLKDGTPNQYGYRDLIAWYKENGVIYVAGTRNELATNLSFTLSRVACGKHPYPQQMIPLPRAKGDTKIR